MKTFISETSGYEPGEECNICRGRCCRERGCSLSPEDMYGYFAKIGIEDGNVDRDKVVRLLTDEEYGLFAIDSFGYGEERIYFLRMKHKCYNFVGVDAAGECIALTDKGCSLGMKDRPKGGRMLKSSPDFKCHQDYSADEMYSDWLPYSKLLQDIFDEYEAKFSADGTFDACDRAYYEYMKSRIKTEKI